MPLSFFGLKSMVNAVFYQRLQNQPNNWELADTAVYMELHIKFIIVPDFLDGEIGLYMLDLVINCYKFIRLTDGKAAADGPERLSYWRYPDRHSILQGH